MRSSTDTITTPTTSSLPNTALLLGPDGLTVRRIRRRDKVLATVMSSWLDAELAAGRAPELRWLRAVRAMELPKPAHRAQLADAWAGVLDRDRQAARRRFGTMVRPEVHDVSELVIELTEKLRAATPVSARGVASASVLLTDGTGPLYRARSVEHLPAALTAALRQLDPTGMEQRRIA